MRVTVFKDEGDSDNFIDVMIFEIFENRAKDSIFEGLGGGACLYMIDDW